MAPSSSSLASSSGNAPNTVLTKSRSTAGAVPGATPAAPAAPAGTKALPSDGARATAREKEAGRLFQMARSAERMGQKAVARRLYERIVEKHPDTEVAKKAEEKLK